MGQLLHGLDQALPAATAHALVAALTAALQASMPRSVSMEPCVSGRAPVCDGDEDPPETSPCPGVAGCAGQDDDSSDGACVWDFLLAEDRLSLRQGQDDGDREQGTKDGVCRDDDENSAWEHLEKWLQCSGAEYRNWLAEKAACRAGLGSGMFSWTETKSEIESGHGMDSKQVKNKWAN